MKRFPKILAATCAAVALSSSLALAAEPAKDMPVARPGHAMAGRHGDMAGPMMGPLAQLPPEKQEAARALMAEHAKAMFPLHQGLYAKMAELEAVNAAGDGEGSKAKAVIRDISDLTAKMLQENSRYRARMFKETGLRVPVMGHGMMGGMMGGGMMGGGMMGGKGGCGMMSGHGSGMGGGMMGGMMGGTDQPAPAPADGAKDPHAGHQN